MYTCSICSGVWLLTHTTFSLPVTNNIIIIIIKIHALLTTVIYVINFIIILITKVVKIKNER